MEKKDILIVAILIGLLIMWPSIDRHLLRPLLVGPETHQQVEPAEPEAAGTTAKETELVSPEVRQGEAPQPAEPAKAEPGRFWWQPEGEDYGQGMWLENSLVRIRLCSYGAAVLEALLKEYPVAAAPGSPPVRLDFSRVPALGWFWAEGQQVRSEYFRAVEHSADAVTWVAEANGLLLERKISLGEGYVLRLEDRVTVGKSGLVPTQIVTLGSMQRESRTSRYAFLGMDVLRAGGEGVQHFASRLPRLFGEMKKRQQLSYTPEVIEDRVISGNLSADWAAVKNKYFVQIARSDPAADEARVIARRALAGSEDPKHLAAVRNVQVEEVAGALVFRELDLEPGHQVVRHMEYYVGPKKYSRLSALGYHAVEIMEFGMWSPISRILLWTLNRIHDWVWPHNYGLAIMLLTVLIRIVFWPITHASTVSMKRLQEIQPLINEIRTKYKDNPQKQQKEMMAIYREYKVNPLGGCLPMLIQIPVFIALFVVLRSAIELRFASFLWIKDLSEPEGLLADVLPIPLNILPVLMALTMHWQQKLTPSGADTRHQKMMLFFPVLMLGFLYNLPSGLVLYWTTNQCLMILQQLSIRHQLHDATPGSKAADSGGRK